MISLEKSSNHDSNFKSRDPTLDVYDLLLALFLFVSPWLFARLDHALGLRDD